MRENIEKINKYFASILGVDNITISVGVMGHMNSVLSERDSKEMIGIYFNKKKIYFNTSTNVLSTYCPVHSGALRVHDEIVTLECDDYFKWVVFFKGFDDDYLKSTVCTEIRKVSKTENVLLDVPNKEKVENTINNIISSMACKPTNTEINMARAFSRLD